MDKKRKLWEICVWVLLAGVIICSMIQVMRAYSLPSLAVFLLSLLCFGAMLYLRSLEQGRQREPAADPNEPIGWRQTNRQLLGFIERLLKGCEDQRISGIQVPTESPFFVVFGVDIIQYPEDGVSAQDAQTNAEMETCNALAEAFWQHSFWPMNIDGRLTCVINLRPVPEDPLQAEAMAQVVIPGMRKSIDMLLAKDIHIRIATSGLSVGLESLSQAYRDTVDIFDQLVLMNPQADSTLIVVDLHESSLPGDHTTRAQTERLFCNYVTTQDFDNARLSLLRLTTYESAGQGFSLAVKKLTENRLEWVLRVMDASLSEPQHKSLRQKIKDISNASYSDELTQAINDWFGELEDSFMPQPINNLVRDVIGYVQGHAFSPELSVAEISEHFKVNASYLSNSFHSQAGIRLIDFIHQQRIIKIKQLLKQTNLTIAQIAKSTGYYNAMTMSRAFKRYEGITPSAYREQ